MRRFLLLVFFLSQVALSAQTVFGVVRDSSGSESVPYATVLVKGTQKGTQTDANGFFKLSLDELPSTLVVRCIGYETKEVTVTSMQGTVQVLLKRQAFFMREVVIGAQKPQVIQQKTFLLGNDFAFYDNFILLLANGSTRTSELILSDEYGTPVCSLTVSGKMETLFRDCFGNVNVQSKDSSWQVYFDYTRLRLLPGVPIAEFNMLVAPAKVYHNGSLFWQFYSFHAQRCVYSVSTDGSTCRFHYECDTSGVQYIQRKYDIRYFLDKRRKGIGYFQPVHWIKSNTPVLQSQIPLDAEDQTFLHPLNAPVVYCKNSVWVFNFTNDRVIRFERNMLPKDTLSCSFHHQPGWDGTLLYDEITDQLYTTYTNNSIKKVVLLDEELKASSATVIENFPFVSHLQIRNNVAYFLWSNRAEATTQRLLYRLPL